MAKRRKKTGSRHGLQAVTLCISTAMVLILLGLVVFSVLTARNLSTYVKQNIVKRVLGYLYIIKLQIGKSSCALRKRKDT